MNTYSKIFLFILTTIFGGQLGFSQSNYGLSYQGIARDMTGKELRNMSITVDMTVTVGGMSYSESVQTVSDDFGIFNAVMSGSSSLTELPWEDGGATMTVTVTTTDGAVTGSRAVQAVPYAFHAGKADRLSDNAEIDPEQIGSGGAAMGQVLKWNGTLWAPANDEVGNGGEPSNPIGPAGGDLSGSYPNPTVQHIRGREVSTATPANGQVLKWNGSTWTPAEDISGGNPIGNAGGDLSGSYPNPTVQNIRGREVSTATPANGQVLKWNGNAWTPAEDISGGNPIGNAGGDLSGSYPNPTVQNIRGREVSTATPANGQVLKWNGSAWTPAEDISGVNPIGNAGGDLSGNYPNPTVQRIQGRNLSNMAPTAGQVLQWTTSNEWVPATVSGGLTLPYSGSAASLTPVFAIQQTDPRGTSTIVATNGSNQAILGGNNFAGSFTGNVNISNNLNVAGGLINLSGGGGADLRLFGSGGSYWSISNQGGFAIGRDGTEAVTISFPGSQLFPAAFRPATNNSMSLGSSLSRWSVVFATNGTINTSDRNLKKNILPISYGLSSLLALNPVTYQWKDSIVDTNTHIGFIAQEVKEIIPEVVTIDGEGTHGMNYSELVPVLIKAIQELNQKIERLENQLRVQNKAD